MVFIVDNDRSALARTYCLEELHTALTNNFDLRFKSTRSLKPVTIDTQVAQAYEPALKQRIDNKIAADLGFATFNARVQHGVDTYLEEQHAELERQMRADDVVQRGPPFILFGHSWTKDKAISMHKL